MESPLTISLKSYFLFRSLIPIFLALSMSLSVLNKNLPSNLQLNASRADAAKTPRDLLQYLKKYQLYIFHLLPKEHQRHHHQIIILNLLLNLLVY